ncbi:MAG: zinc metallopeptidase [Planctomycetaceae bacterium]
MPLFFDPLYFVFLAPALLLMFWAQYRVKSAFHKGQEVPASLTGAAAARHILDQAGLSSVGIEETHGTLSDHYDPRDKVLRLSTPVFGGRNAAAVGIAAHEAGHALQDAQNYAPLVIRNAAVPAATYGGGIAGIFLVIGLMLVAAAQGPLASLGTMIFFLGVLGYGCVLFFQVVNLPVEFDASNRAKRLLDELQIVDADGGVAVRKVLNAAALTYVAGTLQTLLTLAYFIFRFMGAGRRSE